MFQEQVHESLALLRRPTRATIHAQTRAEWRPALIYLLVGMIIAILVQSVTASLQTSLRAQQQQQLREQLGPSPLLGLFALLQEPGMLVIAGIIGAGIGVTLWIGLPYGIGRALGGTPAFGRFFYTFALFLTPLTILDALLALTLSGSFGLGYLLLSLSLDAVRFYFVYLTLRVILNLSVGRAAIAIGVPIIVVTLACCGFFLLVILGAVAQGRS